MAALTGGRVAGEAFGDRLEELPRDALGRARRAIIGARSLNLSTGVPGSDRVAVQRSAARHLLEDATDDTEVRSLRERLGRLDGGMAIVWVGGRTDTERSVRRAAMDAAIGRLSALARGGAIPGAGAAYLAAARMVTDRGSPEARAAVAALRSALERPAWWIARNAHLDARRCVAEARLVAPECGFDVVQGRIVELRATGLVDPVESVVGALRTGAAAASSAMSAAGVILAPAHGPPSPRP
jgi:chaperonin GroEL